jgi:hypothetical protein
MSHDTRRGSKKHIRVVRSNSTSMHGRRVVYLAGHVAMPTGIVPHILVAGASGAKLAFEL